MECVLCTYGLMVYSLYFCTILGMRDMFINFFFYLRYFDLLFKEKHFFNFYLKTMLRVLDKKIERRPQVNITTE